MHYTELHAQLKSHGFNAAIYDEISVVGNNARIYLNGYLGKSENMPGVGVTAKVYLFVDQARRQNNYQNPISGYGLHVNVDIELSAKEKMQMRQHLKHKVMTDLFEKGFALRPVSNFKVISL